MLKNLLKNWKTTSAGIVTIGTAIAHLAYTAHPAEADWTMAITQIMIGIGLLAAGDGAASAQAHADSQAAIKDLQSQVSVNASAMTGNTEQITKLQAGQAAPKDPESKSQ